MRPALWPLLLALCFLAPYSRVNWWGFIPAFGAIIFCAARLRGERMWAWLGLDAGSRQIALSIGLAAAAAYALRPAILSIAASKGLAFDPSAWEPLLRTRPVFQALNEEMLFRGALLCSLTERFGSRPRRRLTVLLGTAAFFSLAHLVFYPIKDGNWLNAYSLWNLFAFSVACNALYFCFGHIGYGYALHVGWNLTRFGGDFARDGVVLAEGAAFNLIEGSALVTMGITPLAAALLWVAWRRSLHPLSTDQEIRS